MVYAILARRKTVAYHPSPSRIDPDWPQGSCVRAAYAYSALRWNTKARAGICAELGWAKVTPSVDDAWDRSEQHYFSRV